jgi:phospholipase C
VRDVNRRQVLAGIGVVTGAAVIGCGGDGGGEPADAAAPRPDGPPVPDAPPAPDAAIADASPDATTVTACTSTSTMTPEQLLAHVDTVVVLCMENRSFDHYLGALRLVEGRLDVEGLLGTESNDTEAGTPVVVHQLDDFTPEDPPHGWDACHAQWNDGANDGFVTEHAGASEGDVMGYHVRGQLPVTYALADAGVVCNRWFCSCLGPTWPNRFYLHGASSNGQQSNFPVFGFANIFDQLDAASVSNLNYYSDVAWATGGYLKLGGLATIEQFFEHAMAGTLPAFSIVDPNFFGAGANDDHPDHDIRLGQALIGSVVAALGQSPQWNRCLIVVTYDEHGGFFDHLPPPATIDADPDFQQLGFRVPSLVIGPTVRRGCAVDTVLEHSSVAATAAKRWGLPALNARAAAANDLSVCIDPLRIDDPLPPPEIPPLTMSKRAFAARIASGRGASSHPELAAAIDRMQLPRGLDRRADADAIARRVLAWAERLGVVRWTE